MTRIIIAISAYFLFILTYGQVSHSHKLDLGLGNEWNAFLKPSTLLDEEGETLFKSELWDNGTFQSASLRNSFKIEGDKYRLKFKLNGSLGIYQTQQNSNRYTYRVGASYRLKYAKKKYLELSPELYRKKREGINTDNAVLTTPFSYTLVKIPLGFDFYLRNKAWLKTQVGYLHKDYDKERGEMLYYQAPYADVVISKKWESGNVTSKLSLKSTTQIRDYRTRSIVFNHDEEDEEFDETEFRDGSRDWRYQFTNIQLDITKNEGRSNVILGLYHTSRIDANRRSTFHEIGPGVQYEVSSAKAGLKTNLRYTVRNYERLAPGAGNDTPLQYKYLRANIELHHRLGTASDFYVKGNVVNRSSNNPNLDTLSFREYFNGFVELGLRWSW